MPESSPNASAPNGTASNASVPNTSGTRATPSPGLLQRLKGWLDGLLVADVFLVIAGALWFAVAVLLQGQGIGGPLALFQSLWEPLFTPAIGLLMAAALVSGLLGWWQRRGQR